tara:strand:+ start:500 stop:1063 length:564 start_codon:yes stop_codon:yes gene_type:complete
MFASIAHANVILSLDPATQTTNTGDLVTVSVMIDGLGDGVPLSLSAFDLDIAFDSSALSFVGYGLFDELGGVIDGIDLSWGEYIPGVINIAELSLLSNFDLWNFQPGSFTLAELFFTVDTAVTSAIAFVYADLVDVNGDTINIIGANNASITGTNPVPTPAALTLMSLALLTMFVRKKYYPLGVKKS